MLSLDLVSIVPSAGIRKNRGSPLSGLVGVDTVGAPLSRLVCVDMVDFEGAITFAIDSKLSLGVPINFFCEQLPLLIFGAADPARDKGPD